MKIISDILNLIFPPVCSVCLTRIMNEEDLICFSCRKDLPKVTFQNPHENELTNRLLGKMTLKFGIAYLYFFKSGSTQKLMHQFKYNNKPAIGIMLGRYLGHDMVNSGIVDGIDYIIPVPIHRKKERIRGYNQSFMFARGLSEMTGITIAGNILFRKTHSESQTHKSREERLRNVSEVFYLKNQERIQGKSILLVDDVVTTGATLEACGTILVKAGCKEISVATIAIAK